MIFDRLEGSITVQSRVLKNEEEEGEEEEEDDEEEVVFTSGLSDYLLVRAQRHHGVTFVVICWDKRKPWTLTLLKWIYWKRR